MKSLPQYSLIRLASSGQVHSTSPCAVMAVCIFGGSANTKVELHNAVDATGTHLFEANTVLGTTHFVDLRPLGGINFSTACYATLAGADGVAYIWFG